MKVSIVGGSGFIGTRLVELLLQRGNEVVIVDKAMSAHYPALTRIADVRDEAALDQVIDADSDVVIHLAAEHKDNVHPIELYYEVNVQGMRNLLSVLGRKGIKQIVFTSSVAIYGLNEGDSTEESPIAPFNDYGKSKYQAEQVLAEWTAQDITRSAVVLRPCVVFGERNRGNVYNLLHSIVNKSFMMVGKGNNHKSMGYVGNLCEFITFLLTHGIATGVEVYNYADKPDLTMKQLVAVVKSTLGRKLIRMRIPYWLGIMGGTFFDFVAWIRRKPMTISSIRIKKFCASTVVNANKAHAIGFTPPYTLPDALKRTIEYEFPEHCSKAVR